MRKRNYRNKQLECIRARAMDAEIVLQKRLICDYVDSISSLIVDRLEEPFQREDIKRAIISGFNEGLVYGMRAVAEEFFQQQFQRNEVKNG